MADPGFAAFVGVPSTPLFREPSGNAAAGFLLWGDGVRFAGQGRNGRVPVHARGRNRSGWVDERGLAPMLFTLRAGSRR